MRKFKQKPIKNYWISTAFSLKKKNIFVHIYKMSNGVIELTQKREITVQKYSETKFIHCAYIKNLLIKIKLNWWEWLFCKKK